MQTSHQRERVEVYFSVHKIGIQRGYFYTARRGQRTAVTLCGGCFRAGKVSMRVNCGSLLSSSYAVMRTRPRPSDYVARRGRNEVLPATENLRTAVDRNLSLEATRRRRRISHARFSFERFDIKSKQVYDRGCEKCERV